MKYLGEKLDIHCGGIDNAFPHHTNEIAQSEAYLGHKWCNYWFHVLHLNTTSGKMSKSSGEFLTLSLLEEKGYSPMVYRFFCLQSHYRKSLVFSYENLDNAKTAYEKLLAKIAQLSENGEVDKAAFAEQKANFVRALDNDLNTSLAVTAVYDVLKAPTNDATKLALLRDFDTVLQLNLAEGAKAFWKESTEEAPADDELTRRIEERIAARRAAKAAKNYAEADRIRAELAAEGVTLIDTTQNSSFTNYIINFPHRSGTT